MMGGWDTLLYKINANITLLSALLGLCFSIGAVRSANRDSRTNALYLFARSLALAAVTAAPFCIYAPDILFVVTMAMLIVQITDCMIGVIMKRKMRVIGPFIMAVCHGICLVMSVSMMSVCPQRMETLPIFLWGRKSR